MAAASSLNNNNNKISSSRRSVEMQMQMSWQPNYQLLRRRKLGLPPLGLKNLGNSCYLNSVLQCLSYTPPLAHFCLTHTHSSICTANNPALPVPPPSSSSDDPDGVLPPVCPLCLLERQISLSHTSLLHDSPLVPSKIRRYLRLFARHFRLGHQEDAHEFLRFLIDSCHNEAKKQQQQPPPKRNHDNHHLPQSHPNNSVFQQIFGGSLLNQVTCLSCGAESNKSDEFMDISLDIFHSSSLLDSLRAFFNPELLDGSNKYHCQS